MIAYDVTNAESDDYENIDKALAKLGTVVGQQRSVRWLHKSSATATQIKDEVVAAAPRRKMTVWVTEAASDRAFV